MLTMFVWSVCNRNDAKNSLTARTDGAKCIVHRSKSPSKFLKQINLGSHTEDMKMWFTSGRLPAILELLYKNLQWSCSYSFLSH